VSRTTPVIRVGHLSGIDGRRRLPARPTITTEGSSFDTELGIYTGSSVGSLTPVAANDDANFPSDSTSAVTFSATAGTTYYIAVDGYYGPSHGLHTGNIVLNWCQVPKPECDQKADFRWHYSSNDSSGS
jgi:hypothetical protein